MSKFKCDGCGGEFDSDDTVTEEDKRVEFEEHFPTWVDAPQEELATVCDECWEAVLKVQHENDVVTKLFTSPLELFSRKAVEGGEE